MKLIEWLVDEKAQYMHADLNYEYPVRSGIAINTTIAGYGALKPDTLSLSKIADQKKAAAALVDKVGFDN
jgi:iron(III) transport system substrate-binding protein